MHGNRVAKRALDLAMGSVALVLAAAIILCAAVLVRLIDGGPSFYFQARSGIDGRHITVPKVRTMRHDAEKRLDKYLAENPELQEEWKERFKLARDPWLIPLVGRLFRQPSTSSRSSGRLFAGT